MTVSLYSATVPGYQQVLPALLGMITKAEDYCSAHGLAPAELIGAQLAPDMWDFAKQIRAVVLQSGTALHGAIAGELAPEFPEPPADFAGLRAMIADAIAQVDAVTPEQLDALSGRDTILRFGPRQMDFTAEDFLLSFAMPNFYFHASAAYAILRMKGVPLSKGDFLGAIRLKAKVTA
jgi:hypothetical protein